MLTKLKKINALLKRKHMLEILFFLIIFNFKKTPLFLPGNPVYSQAFYTW